MATNTILGVNPQRISKLTLDALRTMPIPFSAFTTDLSSDIAQAGDTVTTRYPTNPVTQNFALSKASSNSATTARTVTLYHYLGVALGFNDREMAFSDIRLTEMYIKPALTAMFVNVFSNAAGLVLAATYTQNTVVTAANFNANAIANIGTNMTTANVVQYNRHMIVNPQYALTAKTDPAISAAYAYQGSTVIKDGQLPRVSGFEMHEFNGTIPNNSENLVGWGCTPQGLLIATRVAQTPRNWYGVCEDITDPQSGLTIQFRDYYDGNEQKTELGILYGCQVGNPGNLWRIKSA